MDKCYPEPMLAVWVFLGMAWVAASEPRARPAPAISPRVSPAPSAVPTAAPVAPAILSQVKPALHARILEEREALTSAVLDDADAQGLRRYHFYSVMLVRAPDRLTRKILTDYALYSKMISYVDRADYHAASRILNLEGGIWSFKLHSAVRFEEKAPGWIQYQIVSGSFRGLAGDFFLEGRGEGKTLVMMRGELRSHDFPPKFVIERGAEIVFGFTARRMRTYIESQKNEPAPHAQPSEIPQPRNHL